MKVAVSSGGTDLDSQIDPRFGRCAYFIVCETEDMTYDVFDNENIGLSGGAGIQSAQFVASRGAVAVITGNCGPNAVKTLAAAGVQLYVGQSGTVRESLERFKENRLRPSYEANVSDHFGMGGEYSRSQQQPTGQETDMFQGRGMGMGGGRGMGRGMGMGGGRGMGRGMGMGGGRGMGRGMGMGMGYAPDFNDQMPQGNEPAGSRSRDLTKEEDIDSLRKRARDLKDQIEDIEDRIRKIDKSDDN